jgi:hypothetical protein
MIGRDQIIQCHRKQSLLAARLAHDVSHKRIFPSLPRAVTEFRNRLLRLGLPSGARFAGFQTLTKLSFQTLIKLCFQT